MSLLEVKDLVVNFDTHDGTVCALNKLSFSVSHGKALGIAGESGSGKSQSVFSIMGLLDKNGRASGEVRFAGKEILNLPERELNTLRANEISMIFQDPMTSLNPYMKVKRQLMEILIEHKQMSAKDAFNKSVQMLDAVKISEAKKRMNMYPHELSGGMRQRVMIAMSLLCEPKLLIADEPTTALDVTVQAQILRLIVELQTDFNTAIILISHDLGVIAGLCDDVLVMYAGQAVEFGSVEDIFYRPAHPYTSALLKSIPSLTSDLERLETICGNPPNMLNLPRGCSFEQRCPLAMVKCKKSRPPLLQLDGHRQYACFLKGPGYVI